MHGCTLMACSGGALSASGDPQPRLAVPNAIRAIAATADEKRTPGQREQLAAVYKLTDAERKPLRAPVSP